MAHITILRGGNLLAAGVGDGPLPKPLEEDLQRAMRFTYLRTVEPGDSFEAGGRQRSVSPENVPLYTVDKYGRLTCGNGYLPRVAEACQEHGHTFEVRDLPPLRGTLRPDRFLVDWEFMFEVLARNGTDLRPGQEEGLAAIADHECGLIEAPPGWGKSFALTAQSLAYRNARVHVVVDGAAIIERIHREMVRYIPNVGRVGGGKKKFGRVTLVSAQSLQHVEFEDPTHPAFADVVFCDEVHKLVTENLWPYVLRYRYCRIYGLSATLEGRFDGADAALESRFGRVIYTMSYARGVELGLVVPIEVEWLPLAGPDPAADLTSPTAIVRAGIWRHDARNQLICDRVRALDPDEQALILTDTIDHLFHLKRHFPELVVVYDDLPQDRYDWYVRNGLADPERDPLMTPDRRERLAAMFADGELRSGGRRLAAANRIWDTGVSFDRLETLVVAHGKASKIGAVQGPGRVSRTSRATGKQVGRVIDVYDMWREQFRGYAMARSRVYAKQEWVQAGIPRPTRVRRFSPKGSHHD